MGRIAIAGLLVALLAPAAASAATPDPDGRYRGSHVSERGARLTQKISFRVSRDGRRITRLRTTATALCVGPTLFDNRVLIVRVYLRRIRVASSGRFRGVATRAGDTRFEVTGRRRGRRVGGRIEVRMANCAARDEFVARRVGR